MIELNKPEYSRGELEEIRERYLSWLRTIILHIRNMPSGRIASEIHSYLEKNTPGTDNQYYLKVALSDKDYFKVVYGSIESDIENKNFGKTFDPNVFSKIILNALNVVNIYELTSKSIDVESLTDDWNDFVDTIHNIGTVFGLQMALNIIENKEKPNSEIYENIILYTEESSNGMSDIIKKNNDEKESSKQSSE